MRISSRAFVLTLSMCANVYLSYQIYSYKSLQELVRVSVDSQMVKVSSRGFQIGCEVASQGIGHHSPEDVDWSLVQDWCRHNATVYAPKK